MIETVVAAAAAEDGEAVGEAVAATGIKMAWLHRK